MISVLKENASEKIRYGNALRKFIVDIVKNENIDWFPEMNIDGKKTNKLDRLRKVQIIQDTSGRIFSLKDIKSTDEDSIIAEIDEMLVKYFVWLNSNYLNLFANFISHKNL